MSMIPTARAGLAAALGALILFAGSAAGAGPNGLVVRQTSNGLPGHGEHAWASQEMLVGANALRIDELIASDPESLTQSASPKHAPRYLVVRLDAEKVYEVDDALQMYTEQDFSYYRHEREKSDAQREEARKAIIEKYAGNERAQMLAKNHLREDGQRIVTVDPPSPGEVFRLETGDKHTTQQCIRLNDDPIFHAYTTDEISFDPPPALYAFYEKCGLFEPAVVEKLKAIRGFPLRMVVKVKVGGFEADIETAVRSVHTWPEDASKFAIPTQYKKVDKFPDINASDLSNKIVCTYCGKVIDNPRSAWKSKLTPIKGLWFCSQDEEKKYVDGGFQPAAAQSKDGK
jgi:hypothetical protein